MAHQAPSCVRQTCGEVHAPCEATSVEGAPSFSLAGFELPSPGLGKHALLVDALLGVYSVLVSVAIQARYSPPVP